MQSMMELSQVYLSELSKLDQLLRLYQVTRKTDKFNLVSEKTKQKIKKILSNLRCHTCFEDISEDVMTKVNKVLNEVKTVSLNGNKSGSRTSKNVIEQNVSSNKSLSSYSNTSNANSQKPANVNRNSQAIKKSGSMIEQAHRVKFVQPAKPKQQIFQKIEKSQKLSPSKVQSGSIKPILKKQEPKKQQPVKVEMPVKPVVSAMQFITPEPQQKEDKRSFDLMNSQKSNSSAKSQKSEKDEKIELIVNSMSSIRSVEVVQSKTSPLESFAMLNSSDNEDKLSERRSSKDDKEEDRISEQSQKFFEVNNSQEIFDIISNFFIQNRSRLNYTLIFNNQLFQLMEQELDGHFYLFGINKPESRKITEFYGCTLMKFLGAELFRNESNFQKELKDFRNNIRVPLGLIFKGQKGKQSITPEHIKFLLTLQSPFPIILVLKDDLGDEGVICSFDEDIVERIRITPRKQLGQCAQQLKKKTHALPYSEQHFPADKNKVMTKFLVRQIPNLAEEAPNAISISGNDCIREEKQSFIYKVHTKFLPISKDDLTIYYINNNIINAKMGFKDKEYDAFRKQVLEGQSKVAMLLSVNVAKEINLIRKDFFELLLESKSKRDTFFFINMSSLQSKKTVIATLRPEVTMDLIKSVQPMAYKDFEKDTILTTCFRIISKTNIKEFQVQGKVDLVVIKPK